MRLIAGCVTCAGSSDNSYVLQMVHEIVQLGYRFVCVCVCVCVCVVCVFCVYVYVCVCMRACMHECDRA